MSQPTQQRHEGEGGDEEGADARVGEGADGEEEEGCCEELGEVGCVVCVDGGYL